jgi:hypothetical protein
MAMTYNSLVAQLQTYLERSDPDTVASIPSFIGNAEQRICRESKNIGLEQYIVGNFIVNNPILVKPGRWRRTITFNYTDANNNRNPIRLRSYEFLRTYWPNPALNAPPQFYSDYGWNTILIAPTPDVAYQYEYGYLELPIPISPQQQTNWITNFAPDVLLYACLIEAEPFLRNREDIEMWTDKYNKAITSLNIQDDMRVTDRQSNRESD